MGAEIARKVAKEGAKLALVARGEKLLARVENEITNSGGKAKTYSCDIREGEQVEQTIKRIIKDFKSIDVLVNNAGVWTDDSLEKDKPEMRQNAIETNMLGQIQFTEEVLPYLKEKGSGIIFNIISTAAVSDIPSGDNTIWKSYGASKWGLAGYTHALRESLRDTKIKVIQYFPGGFESNLYKNADRPNSHNQPWMMKTADVAEIVLFALTRPDDMYIEKIVVSKMM